MLQYIVFVFRSVSFVKFSFAETKYFIIDMDGTFYLDGNIIPGSVDFLNTVKQKERIFSFTPTIRQTMSRFAEHVFTIWVTIFRRIKS